MKTVPARLILAVVGLSACQPAFAQTYLGNLDGVSTSSTMELNSTTDLPVLGWTVLSGTPRVFDSTNDAIINGAGLNHSAFSVQYLTSSTLLSNTTYTLSFRMGYFSAPSAGGANFLFQLGLWNGTSFIQLKQASGGVNYNGQFSADGSYGVTESLTYTTGVTASSSVIAVRWEQYEDAILGADFLGFDNVKLSYGSAIPEPSTYAALLGVGAIGFAAWRRRRGPALARS